MNSFIKHFTHEGGLMNPVLKTVLQIVGLIADIVQAANKYQENSGKPKADPKADGNKFR